MWQGNTLYRLKYCLKNLFANKTQSSMRNQVILFLNKSLCLVFNWLFRVGWSVRM